MTELVHPARRTTVFRGADLHFEHDHPSEPGDGVTVAHYLGSENDATHLSVAIVELAPGAQVQGHLHPFEESFFVLAGSVLLNLAGSRFELVPQDFGLIPTTFAHAWANVSETPARLLRVYAPQPRPINGRGAWGVYAAPEAAVPTGGIRVIERDPRHAHVGHFDEGDMAPPGSISMPGYHGANVQNVQIRMMVDELLGARQHAMFIVQFTPNGKSGKSAKEHFHPFEEIYFLLSGQALGSFDRAETPVAAGDLVFAATGASHGFSPVGTQPVAWIEVQSPLPPASHGFTFHNDWDDLEPIG